jgi:hypothetical protein
VDLVGQLSNPAKAVEILADQGSQPRLRPLKAGGGTRNRASEGSPTVVREEKGQLSNPVQRRLSGENVDDLVRAYLNGSSINSLAAQLHINRTTIIGHLDRRGIERRKVVRKMNGRSIRHAAKYYEAGESLKVVAIRFNVDARTLAREFKRADIDIRPRRGWHSHS